MGIAHKNVADGWALSFTRYCFTSEVFVHESILLSLAPSHLHYPHYCNTIARPLRNIRPATDPPFVCHTPYHIGDGNIVYSQVSDGWALTYLPQHQTRLSKPYLHVYISIDIDRYRYRYV